MLTDQIVFDGIRAHEHASCVWITLPPFGVEGQELFFNNDYNKNLILNGISISPWLSVSAKFSDGAWTIKESNDRETSTS